MKDPNMTAKTVMSAITKTHTPSTPGSRRFGSPTDTNWVSVSGLVTALLINTFPTRRGDRSLPDHRGALPPAARQARMPVRPRARTTLANFGRNTVESLGRERRPTEGHLPDGAGQEARA